MKKVLLGVWALGILMVVSLNATAEVGSDQGFLRKFSSYQAKYKISTYRTAKAFASHMKTHPEKVLKRYISASFAAGGRAQESAVKNGIDAFKESGMTHEAALVQVSDTVGQMTDTLQAIYARVSPRPEQAPAKRGLASVRRNP